jgi:uncharacterized membrane protein (Fun14 family)
MRSAHIAQGDPMSEVEAPVRKRRQPVREFFAHLVDMPSWQRKLLIGAVLLAAAGLVGQSSKLISRTPSQRTVESRSSSSNTDASARSFARSADSPNATIDVPPPKPTLVERLSPWASRVGFGFVGGFIIGWAFRAFIKTMAIVTAVGLAIFWGLTHFAVINVDFSGAEAKFKDSTSWVSEQAELLKERAMTLIPSSFSTVVGAFLGFRRK